MTTEGGGGASEAEGGLELGSGQAAASAGAWRLVFAIALWGIVALASIVAARPPATRGVDAPATVASGARASGVLERIARGDGGRLSPPRPPGSAANAACRERIVAELQRLGLRPEVDERFGVSTLTAAAGVVHNVVVRIPGTGGLLGPRQSILCMAHYDSVGAGPGIGDDLAGVAALLEATRALQAGDPTRRDVVLLFEDGEEHGLLGAEVFAAQHPLAPSIGAVVNFEARGTEGPSRLFEFGPDNAASIEAFAAVASRPCTSSLSAEIYSRMPNNTDYTVWRERGIPGLNFAFIGGVHRYHTALDDIENLSPQSLQHHATNSLDAIRAFDRVAELPGERGSDPGNSGEEGAADAVDVEMGQGDAVTIAGDAVFFDVFSRWLPHVRVRTARLWSWAVLLAALFGIGRSVRIGGARPSRVALGLVGMIFTWALMLGAADLEKRFMGVLGLTSSAWPAHQAPVLVGIFAAASGAAALASGALQRFMRPRELGGAVLGAMALLTAALAFEAPGASYMTLLPTTALAIGALLMRTRGDIDARWCRASALAVGLGALTMTPMHAGLIDAFGVGTAAAAAAPLALVATFLFPLLVSAWSSATRWVAALAFAIALLAAVFVSRLDAQTLLRPGQQNLVYAQSPSRSHWEVQLVRGEHDDRLAGALREASGVSAPDDGVSAPSGLAFSWSGARTLMVAVPSLGLDPPVVEELSRSAGEGGNVTVILRVTSARAADQIGVRVTGATLRVDGRLLRRGRVTFLGPREEGEVIEVTLTRGVVPQVKVWDKRFGFEPAIRRVAEPLLAVMPPEFVPAGDGHGSVVFADVVLGTGDPE